MPVPLEAVEQTVDDPTQADVDEGVDESVDEGGKVDVLELRRKCNLVPVNIVNAKLSERFLMPPFSVLDARQGYWQTRKRAWLSIGIQSELGRGDNVLKHSDQSYNIDFYAQKRDLETELGKVLSTSEAREILIERGSMTHVDRSKPKMANTFSKSATDLVGGFQDHPSHRAIPGGGTGKNSAFMFKTEEGYKSVKKLGKAFNIGMQASAENGWQIEDDKGSGTSIFDPVLCELAYRWFSPVGGTILDPFAGGSVRGVVAARLKRAYVGIDLRGEQIEANYAQKQDLCPTADLYWLTGDSAVVLQDIYAGNADKIYQSYDFVFSCPPYADLERYSDDPADISTMSYEDFMEVYRDIVAKSCRLLKDNRFACFVVGDMRDKRGMYRNFVADTIAAFRDAGLELYNEAVLVTSVGSLPVRVGKQFAGYRKLGKTHQNVLVFVKGDPGLASQACGPVDVDDFDMPGIPTDEPVIAVASEDMTREVESKSFSLWRNYAIKESGKDAWVLFGDLLHTAAACDVMRSRCRDAGTSVTRVWIAKAGVWTVVPEGELLTIIAGGSVVLNPSIFGGASARETVESIALQPVKFGVR